MKNSEINLKAPVFNFLEMTTFLNKIYNENFYQEKYKKNTNTIR